MIQVNKKLNRYERRIKNNFYRHTYLLNYPAMEKYLNNFKNKQSNTIAQDKHFRLLEHQYQTISNCLLNADNVTTELIKAFYFTEQPNYTLNYFAENILLIPRKQANRLINNFIDNLEFELLMKRGVTLGRKSFRDTAIL